MQQRVTASAPACSIVSIGSIDGIGSPTLRVTTRTNNSAQYIAENSSARRQGRMLDALLGSRYRTLR
jgi:hypothetical protein